MHQFPMRRDTIYAATPLIVRSSTSRPALKTLPIERLSGERTGKKQRTQAHSENALTDAKSAEPSKSEWNLLGFRPVYVWDGLSRDFRESELRGARGDYRADLG